MSFQYLLADQLELFHIAIPSACDSLFDWPEHWCIYLGNMELASLEPLWDILCSELTLGQQEAIQAVVQAMLGCCGVYRGLNQAFVDSLPAEKSGDAGGSLGPLAFLTASFDWGDEDDEVHLVVRVAYMSAEVGNECFSGGSVDLPLVDCKLEYWIAVSADGYRIRIAGRTAEIEINHARLHSLLSSSKGWTPAWRNLNRKLFSSNTLVLYRPARPAEDNARTWFCRRRSNRVQSR